MADVLYIHGIGHAERDPGWKAAQEALVVRSLSPLGVTPSVESLAYDSLFAEAEFSAQVVFQGGGILLSSLAEHGLDDLLGVGRDRGGWSHDFRWSIGMVAQWAALEDLRAELQARLRDALLEHDPKIIIGHSLGSLIAYDTFSDNRFRSLLAGRMLVTLGSQIGHPAVRAAFGGRVETLAGNWVNLFNRNDKVFTEPLHPSGDGSFVQLATEFTAHPPLNHSAQGYFGHSEAQQTLWPAAAALLLPAQDQEEITSVAVRSVGVDPLQHPRSQMFLPVTDTLRASERRRTRAVLVGIDDYKGGITSLKGCVNDQFELSSVLQECGFQPENIRALFNQNATSAAIHDRLKWLLDEASPGDTLVFCFSGHGAQVTPRGFDGMPRAHMECLLPHDCDWTPTTLISDASLVQLYADLPFGVNLVMILDCCHSGGVWRNVGAQVRGVPPPDDLRHEGLYWNKDEQIWVPRRPKPIDPQNPKFAESPKLKRATVGEDGNVMRLGRATPVRSTREDYVRQRESKGHGGPFTPIVFQACRSDQLASEYLHGSITYGVFTYAFTRALRRLLDQPKSASVEDMVKLVNAQLRRLNYAQSPEVAGPEELLKMPATEFFQIADPDKSRRKG